MKVVFALLCCFALLASPAVALAGFATGTEAGCCHASKLPCAHDAEADGHHGKSEPTPMANCAALCAAACCLAVLPTDFVLEQPTLADFAWRDFRATGALRTDRPPLPPPRA